MLNKVEEPNDKQKLFLLSKTRFTAYGGSRGGGKSWAVRKKALLMGINYPGIKMLILRRTFPELRENHILPLMAELNGVATYKETEKAFIFPNGSRLRFGYCDSEADVLQYQGQEFDIIFMDEATQFTEYQYNTLTACLRGANDFPKRFYLTCNPGGAGHEWVKRLFIDKDYRNSEDPNDYTFISAKVYDNKALMDKDKGYVQMLENLPEELRRAWLDGDWNVFAGQYFSEFREDVHVIDPFPIPEHWNRYFACDYGLDMFAGLWIARDPQGNSYVYKEVHEPELIITEAVKRYKEMNDGDNIKVRYAPPDLWNRRNDTGRSASDIFQQQGVILTKYDNNRVLGWYNIKEWLQVIDSRDEQTGEPILTSRLKIMRSCPTLIKHLPLMQRDPKNPNDCLNEPHYITHICDSLRGYCISWTVPGKELPEPKTEHDRYVEKVLNSRKKSRQKLV